MEEPRMTNETSTGVREDNIRGVTGLKLHMAPKYGGWLRPR